MVRLLKNGVRFNRTAVIVGGDWAAVAEEFNRREYGGELAIADMISAVGGLEGSMDFVRKNIGTDSSGI